MTLQMVILLMCEHGSLGETRGAAGELEIADSVREHSGLGVVEAVGVDAGALELQVAVRGEPVRLAHEDDDLWSLGSRSQLSEERSLV